MAFNGSGGGNPRYGRDAHGTHPPVAGVPFQYNGQTHYYTPMGQPAWPYAPQPFVGQFPAMVPGSAPYLSATSQIPVTAQPSVMAQAQGPMPVPDRGFRTCSMRNTTGGYGCEPGYNYFFPAEHTKIHVLKTGSTPPWQLPPNFAIQFHACHVPVNTTVAELMKGFGAKNSVPKKNVITEVCPGGGGKWYKGIEARGDNFELLKKPIKDLGWDATRTGLRGQKKVVYIYVQKD